MQYEVWEFKYGVTYSLFESENEHATAMSVRDGGRQVLVFEADTWEDAKRIQNDYVSEIRNELLDQGQL